MENEVLAQQIQESRRIERGATPGGYPLPLPPPFRAWGAPWFIAGRSENSWSQAETWPWEGVRKGQGLGFALTSYPSRCTRPPLMAGPPDDRLNG